MNYRRIHFNFKRGGVSNRLADTKPSSFFLSQTSKLKPQIMPNKILFQIHLRSSADNILLAFPICFKIRAIREIRGSI